MKFILIKNPCSLFLSLILILSSISSSSVAIKLQPPIIDTMLNKCSMTLSFNSANKSNTPIYYSFLRTPSYDSTMVAFSGSKLIVWENDVWLFAFAHMASDIETTYIDSDTITYHFFAGFYCSEPILSSRPTSCLFIGKLNIYLFSSALNSRIYYTLNGITADTNSIAYGTTIPLSISATTILNYANYGYNYITNSNELLAYSIDTFTIFNAPSTICTPISRPNRINIGTSRFEHFSILGRKLNNLANSTGLYIIKNYNHLFMKISNTNLSG